jgi:hypothetical protein
MHTRGDNIVPVSEYHGYWNFPVHGTINASSGSEIPLPFNSVMANKVIKNFTVYTKLIDYSYQFRIKLSIP